LDRQPVVQRPPIRLAVGVRDGDVTGSDKGYVSDRRDDRAAAAAARRDDGLGGAPAGRGQCVPLSAVDWGVGARLAGGCLVDEPLQLRRAFALWVMAHSRPDFEVCLRERSL
jgi:hypothetical protein